MATITDRCPDCNGTQVIDKNIQGFRDPYPCPTCVGGQDMTTAERKSLNAERQQQAEQWMKLKLEIVDEETAIHAAEMRLDNLVNSLKRAAKDLEGCVGHNQPEKIYDVRKKCDTDRLVRVKFEEASSGSEEVLRETSIRIDTIEIEDRE